MGVLLSAQVALACDPAKTLCLTKSDEPAALVNLQSGYTAAQLGSFISGGPTSPRAGYYTSYQNIEFYYSDATGAHEVNGAIRTKWDQLGRENWGFPTSDEQGTADGLARFNNFENATIYWTAGHGAFELNGAIRDAWTFFEFPHPSQIQLQGKPTQYDHYPSIGYPISDETAARADGGRYNWFENGGVYWSPASGAHRVYGTIFTQWFLDGGETNAGFPIEEPNDSSLPDNLCWRETHQTFRSADGTRGGVYCDLGNGKAEFHSQAEIASLPHPSGGLPSAGTAPSSGMMPAVPSMPVAVQGEWRCSVNGIPEGEVSTQYDPYQCLPYGADYVQAPVAGMWVCKWAQHALDKKFDRNQTEYRSVCGTYAHLLVADPNAPDDPEDFDPPEE